MNNSSGSKAVKQLLWTIKETAEALQISERTLHDLRKRGGLSPVRLGRSVRYRPADVEAYIDRLAREGG